MKLDHPHLLAIGKCAFATLLGASAYIVYHNTTMDYPTGASFFWFILFAFLAALCLPREEDAPYYRANPVKSWWETLKRVSLSFYLFDGLLQTVYYLCMLTALHSKQAGAVLTILVVNNAKPVGGAFISHYYLGDTCKSWRFYILGTATTIVGVFIYKYQSWYGASAVPEGDLLLGVNAVLLLSVLAMIFNLAQGQIDAKYRRGKKDAHGEWLRAPLPQADAIANVMGVCCLTGLVWMFYESAPGLPPLPTLKQLGGLIYLGVVPTAIAPFIRNSVRDVKGTPVVDAIDNAKPVFALLV